MPNVENNSHTQNVDYRTVHLQMSRSESMGVIIESLADLAELWFDLVLYVFIPAGLIFCIFAWIYVVNEKRKNAKDD